MNVIDIKQKEKTVFLTVETGFLACQDSARVTKEGIREERR